MENKKTNNLLTAADMEIMDLLWQSERPVSCTDLLASGKIEGWTSGYLHNVFRSMLKKGAIRVNGMVQNNTQYARTFEPAITRAEYAAKLALSAGINKDEIILVEKALMNLLDIK